ncbi:hypothetical protein BCR43DRAFT_499289 [Syncephalastrum racemosum]|uniref:Uncharacterized protein n=1 Tax=Syncephalastrum racemosum TaxID=13706 RepID=A0A1X2H045_SYNRA|nr:hypothetical protein BCR43DRAFT_499289 [Syncephalastrum racemosum]
MRFLTLASTVASLALITHHMALADHFGWAPKTDLERKCDNQCSSYGDNVDYIFQFVDCINACYYNQPYPSSSSRSTS